MIADFISYTPWLLFNGFILLVLLIDLFVVHKDAHAVNIKEATGWSILWVSLALLFDVFIYFWRGTDDAVNFLTGYLIEQSLSVDNLFVFLLIFKYFHTPKASLHRVLFFGVLGAVLFRGLFIWLGIALLSSFHWIIYVFGAFLICTGIKLGLEKDKQIHPERNPLLLLFRRFFPVTNDYDHDHFFVVKQARIYATPLFIVLLSVETTDIVFAVDSVPAVLAITSDPFIVYTSNIFAILGLRSMFFVLSHMASIFHYLHYAISFILVFVGIKMLMADIYHIHNLMALAVIFTTLVIAVTASLLFPVKINTDLNNNS